MGAVPACASVGEALEMVRAGLGYLAAADATQLSAEAQAGCLRELEQDDAMVVVVDGEADSERGQGEKDCEEGGNDREAAMGEESGDEAGETVAGFGHLSFQNPVS